METLHKIGVSTETLISLLAVRTLYATLRFRRQLQ